MPDPSVLAIVVAHPSRTRVAEVLRSLSEQTYDEIAIVVAAIGEITVPEETSPTIVAVRDGAGFAEAVTYVLSTVRSEGFSYLLFLHDDVSLEPDAVERMMNTARSDPAIAAVGAKLTEWYEPGVLQEVGAAIDRFAIRRSALDAGEVDAGQRDETSDVLFCSDACLLVRSDAMTEVGGFDEKAWPFYEDVDLCWRLRALGARVVVDPQARARHAADLSRGRRLFESLALREHAEHGRLRFMLKHYAPLGLAVLLPQVFIASVVRIIGALARRELWRMRVIVGAWFRLLREFPAIMGERRRAPKARVEDRELLALAARGAVGDVRSDRSEWASRFLAAIGRSAERLTTALRQPVTWVTIVAIAVVVGVLRNVLFGGTFTLGELREIAPFGEAISDHFGLVRREGLDPFGPAGPGLIVLSLIRSVLFRAGLAEKVVLLAPLFFTAFAGARIAGALLFGAMPRRWIAVAAAINPITLVLLRDGAIGALVLWAASLWLVSQLLAPPPFGDGLQARVRFFARWAVGWAIAVALHPPAFLWLLALGFAVTLARRPTASDQGDQTPDRLRILASGALGSFVLLLPWSAQWLTLRSQLVGRPGWLVHAMEAGLERASLGGGWPFIALLVISVLAALYVGVDRTTFMLALLAGLAVLAGATGAFPRESMLAGAGVCAFLIVTIAARHIIEEIGRYEFGTRQAAVFVAVAALAVIWIGAAVNTVPPASRQRALPVIAGVSNEETGRVLWLAETTGGVRAWSTLSFSERLGAFPPPAGPEERMVTKAIEAARAGRTHRLGGVLALADVSHIIALDAESRRGLRSQADLAPQEEQGAATVFRNDGWQGPAMLLAAPPADPLSPSGLAGVVRSPRRIEASGWPYGPITLRPSEDDGGQGVVYVAGGHRGGLRIEGAAGRIAAAGAYVPASDVEGSVDVDPPGRWWRWMLVLQALIVVALLGAWLTAAYVGAPIPAAAQTPLDLSALAARPVVLAVVPLLILAGVALGWSGLSWGVGTPFLSSAWYCPPIGKEYDQRIAITNPNDATVEYLVRSDLTSEPVRASRIRGRSRTTLDISSGEGAVIESYGRRLVVGTEVSRRGALDASLCASDTRGVSIFPEGGRFATRAIPRLFERYIVYNPFPDLARASVQFVSPDETIRPPALQDIRVRPGSFVLVDPEASFEPMLDLSATIRVWQGRAIVARRLRTSEQVTWSLAVDETMGGILPRAVTAQAATNLIAVNLADDPAHITVFGAGRTGSLPEETFDVSPLRRNDFEITTLAPRAADLVIGVESDLPIAMESLVAPDDRSAVSLMPPMQPQRRWVLPIAERRELVLVNGGTRNVRVRFTRLGPGPDIPSVTIGSNRVARVRMRGASEFGVLVEANGGVTAAAVGPRGSMPGVPLP